MSILTYSGRVAIAKAIANESIFLAWGVGDPSWDDTPVVEDIAADSLYAEIGRRRASVVGYCLPDEAGEIVTTDGRFAQSVDPTRYLFFRFAFDYADAADANIRELGVFLGTEVNPELPPGQMYYTPSQLTATGTLLLLEHITKYPRSQSSRIVYEQVFPI